MNNPKQVKRFSGLISPHIAPLFFIILVVSLTVFITSFLVLAYGVDNTPQADPSVSSPGHTTGNDSNGSYDTYLYDLNDRINYFLLRTNDYAGDGTSSANSESYIIDAISPDTVLSLDPALTDGSNGWFKATPSITLAASNGSTTATFYKWDGAGSYSHYISSFDALEGTHTLFYYSTDNSGNIETVKRQVLMVDTDNPIDPILASTSHTVCKWLNDNTIDILLSGATDGSSGVDGFSYSFTEGVASSRDMANESMDIEEITSNITSSSLEDGQWYFHIRTIDNAGNITSTAHLGPFKIETLMPTDPNVSSTSHTTGIPSTDNTIDISFSGATDSVASSETQITTNGSDQYSPEIYRDKIVWQDYRSGNGDIYMYDISASKETQITTNLSLQSQPDIYQDKIIWKDMRYGVGKVYMYDMTSKTESRISKNPYIQTTAAIYENRIVWEDERNGYPSIYMYDLLSSQESRISINTRYQRYPAMYQDKIVWQDMFEGNYDIYIHDLSLSTNTRITTNTSEQSNPAIYQDKIVWQDHRNGNYDIYMYDLTSSTESQITDNVSQQYSPAIYQDKIVWQDHRNGNYDIYMYDLTSSTESQITDNMSQQFSPAIYQDKIVWQDYRNGNYDIYMYQLGSTGSGVDGFSYIFTQGVASSRDVPDTKKDIEETGSAVSSHTLGDGSWYFHLRSRDNAGNWTPAIHSGPYIIETTPSNNNATTTLPPATTISTKLSTTSTTTTTLTTSTSTTVQNLGSEHTLR